MYSKEELIDLASKTMIIYKITNLINGKMYIGQTINTFNKRYNGLGVGVERVKKYYEIKGNIRNEHLYNAIIKYGVDNFKVEIVCQCSSIDELNEKEEYYINLYNTTDYNLGYNAQQGGDNHKRAFKWRLDRLLYNEDDKKFFTWLVSEKYIDKDLMLNLLNTPVVYIKKNGSTKKYYYYTNIRLCCMQNGLSVEDGFCMAMRKRDNSKDNKKIYHHVHITKHEIWFREDINIDRTEFENYKNRDFSNNGRPRKNKKETVKKKQTIHYKPCPICGKTTQSRFKMCSDCKRKAEEQKKINK